MSSLNELDAPGLRPGASSANRKNDVLVLGVGNVMMGDEGLGVHVVRHLLERYIFPPGVEVVDGGTGGLALLPFIQSSRFVIIVDALDAEAEAGSIFMCDASRIEQETGVRTSLHDTGILDVINTAGLLGERPDAVIIGVQPLKMDEFGGGLTEPVAGSIERVCELVCEHLEERGLSPHPKGRCSAVGPGSTDVEPAPVTEPNGA